MMDSPTGIFPAASDHYQKGLAEILGDKDAEEFLRSSQVHNGDAQTRGTLIMAGRAGFYYWLRQNRESIGWDDLAFRLNPVKKKIAAGLEGLCLHLSNETKNQIRYKNEGNHWHLEFYGAKDALPCSYLWGFVQEYARWAGIGRFYEVREKACHLDNGSLCELIIKKDPQD
jgi:hypothetical protein